jgi:hypothetical protein
MHTLNRIIFWFRRFLLVIVFIVGTIGTAQVILDFTLIDFLSNPTALSITWIVTILLGIIEWLGLKSQLSDYENALPNIVYVDSHFTDLSSGKDRIFSLLQVWFVNDPRIRSPQSEANRVEAYIEFWSNEEYQNLFNVVGQWLEASAPTFKAFKTGLGVPRPRENIGYVTPSKLRIAFKWPEEKTAYGYAFEDFVAHEKYIGGQNPDHALPEEGCRVLVKLKSNNVKEDYLFQLIQDNEGEQVLRLVPIIGKDKRKWLKKTL